MEAQNNIQPMIQKLTCDRLIVDEYDAEEYWTKKINDFLEKLEQGKYIANVTFKYCTGKEKSFWDKLLFRNPVEVEQFTTEAVSDFWLITTGSIINGDKIPFPLVWLFVTQKDSERFMENNPVDESGNWIVQKTTPHGQPFIQIEYVDIISITLTEQ